MYPTDIAIDYIMRRHGIRERERIRTTPRQDYLTADYEIFIGRRWHNIGHRAIIEHHARQAYGHQPEKIRGAL